MRRQLQLTALTLAVSAGLLACPGGSAPTTRARLEKVPDVAGVVRPSQPLDQVDRATSRAITEVIQGVVAELNGTGANLGAYYLADRQAVFFGPPSSGPELTRTVTFDQESEEIIQTGVIAGSEVSQVLASCLASFAEQGQPVTLRINEDLNVRVSGPLAFATLTGINTVAATHSAAPWRWTLILERVQVGTTQRWMIVHDHLSFS